MSVMILSEKHFNTLAVGLVRYHRVFDYSDLDYDAAANLVSNLHSLNFRSYDKRYNETSEIPEYKVTWNVPAVSEIATLKLLQCALYQIEFDLTRNQDLVRMTHDERSALKKSETIMTRWMHSIVERQDGYEKAAWAL